jgi:hypothetical protein
MPPSPLPIRRRTIAAALSADACEALLLILQDVSLALYSVVAITMRECITAVSQGQCFDDGPRPMVLSECRGETESGAAGSGSTADTGGRRLQPVVRL